MPKKKKITQKKSNKLDDVLIVTSIAIAVLTICMAVIFIVLQTAKENKEYANKLSSFFRDKSDVLGDVDTTVSVSTYCGNSVKEGSEQCDGSDLGGATCITRGFDGGALGCKANCTFDTSTCTECGNGVKESGEQCDGSDLNSKTCLSLGYDAGTLSCKANCTFETSSCSYTEDSDETTTSTTITSITTSAVPIAVTTSQTSVLTSTKEKEGIKDTDGDGLPDDWENNFTCVDYLKVDNEEDYDEDGLDNEEEYLHDCNPCLSDTDNDGMDDEWEVENGLNPNLDDSSWNPDNDGFSNLEEYLNDTNPKSSDKEPDVDLPTTGGKEESLVTKWLVPVILILLGVTGMTVLLMVVLKIRKGRG